MTDSLHQTLNRISSLLHRRFLVALLTCYVVAGLLPTPGDSLSRVSVDLGPVTASFQTAMLVVAMFVAGLGINTRPNSDTGEPRIGVRQWGRAFGGMMALRFIFLIIAVFMVIASQGQVSAVGLLFVFAMPSAMSAVPWTHKSNGNVKLTMGLIVGSLLAAPAFMTIGLLLISSSDLELGTQTSGAKSINSLIGMPIVQLFVFAPPVLFGLVASRFLSIRQRTALTPTLKLIPAMVILLLNYCNASRVVPNLQADGQTQTLLVVALMTLAAVAIVMATSHGFASWMRLEPRDRIALTYSSGMLNTGMAMVIAATWLPGVPALLIPILFFTLGQHVFAAISEKRRELSMPVHDRCPRTMTTSPVSINEP